jgi:dienelactone hydrolase
MAGNALLMIKFDIPNRDGKIRCEFYQAGSDAAVIYMGGVGGGTHGPSYIYHPLAEDLEKQNISGLLVNCRFDSDLNECISDILACIEYLDKTYHMNIIGLIGWSFGGAVVISAAERDNRVKTVVTVASQSYGTGDVSKISPASILLIHGMADKTLPYECSVDIERRAKEPKKLLLFPNGDHGVSQHREEMYEAIKSWLVEKLTPLMKNTAAGQ